MKIEYVCTANCGRSVPSELIARMHLAKIGKSRLYEITSSGTGVNDISKGVVSNDFRDSILRKALDRGDIFKDEDSKSIENALENGPNFILINSYKYARNVFHKKEISYRSEAIKEFGLEGTVKEKGEQTVVNSDVIALFPMAQQNVKQAQQIYNNKYITYENIMNGEIGLGDLPIIATPGQIVTSTLDSEIPNAFGESRDTYFNMVEILCQYIPKTVDFVIEHSR